jgi:GTP cyclohydrolase II
MPPHTKKRKTGDEPAALSTSADAIPKPEIFTMDYVPLTTHPEQFGSKPTTLNWGAADPMVRGPVIATVKHGGQRNAIGAHSGGYCIYTALAVAAGELNPSHIPNLNTTQPTDMFESFPSWKDPKRLVTIDPWGHLTTSAFKDYYDKGYDIRPTIAVTKAHIDFPEVKDALREGRLKGDGVILKNDGQSLVTKAAVEPVWYLPGVAERFGCSETTLRHALFKETNMMYPELLTRHDIKVFLPPIGGLTIYIWGDPLTIPDENVPLTVRVHDECNGSDVFGSDICTCRPYLAHAIEECIRCAQNGGAGICIYYRKEGRSLGEVTKYLVYNMRKRAEGGDQASEYFNCTKNVAGITDTRFQAMMPDALQWLGVTKIDRFISMSDMKYDAIVATGIKIVERVPIPPELVPKDAQVEIQAKVFVGYHGGDTYSKPTEEDLKHVKGRATTEYGSKIVGGDDVEKIDPLTGKHNK